MTKFFPSKYILLSIPILLIMGVMVTFLAIGVTNRTRNLSIQQETKPPKSPAGIFSNGEHQFERFSFTEYKLKNNDVEKSYVISGQKFSTARPKIGIFRIAIGKVIELESPEITFYKDNLPVALAKSKTATMNPINNSINFYSNVLLITEDKRTLSCEQLKWDNNEKYLLAKGDCILSVEEKITKAEKIKTDIELKNFNIIGGR